VIGPGHAMNLDRSPAQAYLDLDSATETFTASDDMTVGLEEEFALLDPTSLDLVARYGELAAAAADDPVLSTSVAGELISSEIEIRSGRGTDLHDAFGHQREARRRLFALAAARGVALGATGTHPWADYREQRIIDTEHYRRVEEGLKYVAWRNNTFSLHVHVGIRGADRAVRVCDRLRPVLPLLLAVSANSACVDGRDAGLHSARTQIFTKSFPRCGVPDAYGSWAAYREYVELLVRTGSIVEDTQLWWSVRPHFRFGTVEVRICDAQATAAESEGVAALIVACVAQAARDVDEGRPFSDPPRRLVEENMWRAIRHGLDGRMIDLDRGVEYPAGEIVERLAGWTAPVRAELGIDLVAPELNGAQRQRRALDQGAPPDEVYAASVRETSSTYVQEVPA
jgi:carboxylate-amine ligase